VESIGEKLRSVRESKKLTIREVAKDTNIAPRYIEALENEDFDKFPGETYIMGFLRSYSEYLKLDADDVIQSYKGHKIGESATPLEELTRPTKPELVINLQNIYSNHRYLLIGAGVVVVLIVFVLVWGAVKSRSVSLSSDDSITDIKKNYETGGFDNIYHLKLTGGKEIVQVSKNEAVQFIVDTKEVMFVVRDIKNDNIGIELLPQKAQETLAKDMPKMLSIPGVTRTVTVTLKGLTEGKAGLRIELGESDDDAKSSAAPSAGVQPVVGDQTKVTAQNTQNLKIVFEAEFTAKTYVEIYLDGAEKTRGVVMPGRKERWEANSNIQMKIGNAGGVKARINGKDYTFGLPGQVANKIISWKKDAVDPNQYQIVIRDWY
jgi:cytoskeletal protein RodZ